MKEMDEWWIGSVLQQRRTTFRLAELEDGKFEESGEGGDGKGGNRGTKRSGLEQ